MVEIQLDLLVDLLGCFVRGSLYRVLGIANGLLGAALKVLRRAFGTKLVGTNGLADALLNDPATSLATPFILSVVLLMFSLLLQFRSGKRLKKRVVPRNARRSHEDVR